MAAVVVRGAAHRLRPQPLELGVPGTGAPRGVQGGPPRHRIAPGGLGGGRDRGGHPAQQLGAGRRVPVAVHRQPALDEQGVGIVRGGAAPAVEPFGAGAGEGGEGARVVVPELPFGVLAGGGEEGGGRGVLAARRGDEGGGETVVGGVEEHVVVLGGPGRPRAGPGRRPEERAQHGQYDGRGLAMVVRRPALRPPTGTRPPPREASTPGGWPLWGVLPAWSPLWGRRPPTGAAPARGPRLSERPRPSGRPRHGAPSALPSGPAPRRARHPRHPRRRPEGRGTSPRPGGLSSCAGAGSPPLPPSSPVSSRRGSGPWPATASRRGAARSRPGPGR